MFLARENTSSNQGCSEKKSTECVGTSHLNTLDLFSWTIKQRLQRFYVGGWLVDEVESQDWIVEVESEYGIRNTDVTSHDTKTENVETLFQGIITNIYTN